MVYCYYSHSTIFKHLGKNVLFLFVFYVLLRETTYMKKRTKFPCNIDPQLFEKWKRWKRFSDIQQICKEKQYSQPIISRALKYGYVLTPRVTEAITAFFIDRQEKERAFAEKLK